MYFLTTRVLSQCQAHWAHILTCFDFLLTYHHGVQQGKADALPQRSYLAPCPREFTFDHQKRVLLVHDRLRLMANHVFEAPIDLSLWETIRTNIKTNSFCTR